ncbi:MAG: hypothetical protein ABIQ40_11360 [Bacteroidia bacterium]
MKILYCLPFLFLFSCSDNSQKGKQINDSAPDSVQRADQIIENLSDDQLTAVNSADAQGIEFGFSNAEGNKVLLLADTIIGRPAFSVIGSDGEISVLLAFRKRQFATSSDNGRQTSGNFANCAGFLYEIKGSPADADKSVVFLTQEFLTGRTYFKVNEIKQTALQLEIKSRVEADKKRKIKNFRCLTVINNKPSVYLFEFENKGDSALAALAYITPGKIVYEDFPALWNESSTWRVDDGGNFGVDYFQLLAVFEKNGKLEIVTDWPGAEGINTEYLREEGNAFKSLKEASRYTAPE